MTTYVIWTLAIILAIVAGYALWSIYYGFELWMNGAVVPAFGKKAKYVWQEFIWCFSKKARIQYAEKMYESSREREGEKLFQYAVDRMSKDLPGIPHFIFTHLFIPFVPALVGLGLYHMFMDIWKYYVG